MYTDCVASSSRLAAQDYWDPPASMLPFPLSDCRFERILRESQFRNASDSSKQSASKPLFEPAQSLSSSSSLTHVSLRTHISPGVWTDGNNTVYSSQLPEVQQLLATARSTLNLPAPSSELIFTLAALDVFYKPGDPVHWMFWSDDKKNATADVVTRISLRHPPLIHSPVAWNGKPEYLSILANHHGNTWRQIYESKPWFNIVVPPKPTTPPRLLNLRKRKVLPGAFREPSRSPCLEELEADELITRPSRMKARASASPEPVDEVTSCTKTVQKRASRSRASRAKPKAPTPSPPSSASISPVAAPSTLSPEDDLALLPEEIDAAVEIPTSRRKRKVGPPPSRYPKPISSSNELSPPPLESSLLLGASESHLLPLPQGDANLPSHARNRSTSTDSSAKTVVASNPSRGTSVSSGMTAVESGLDVSPSKKRKADTLIEDELQGEEPIGQSAPIEQEDERESLDLDVAGVEGLEREDEGAVTRGRSARSKKQAKNLSDAVSDKLAKSGSTTRSSGRKRARKA